MPSETTLPGRLDPGSPRTSAELVALRRHIHAHPELSGQEFATAALVATQAARRRPRAA